MSVAKCMGLSEDYRVPTREQSKNMYAFWMERIGGPRCLRPASFICPTGSPLCAVHALEAKLGYESGLTLMSLLAPGREFTLRPIS